ncbi:MAG: tetraacyldisaccharide 4'-kinase [Bacteroidales bacterium]
MGRRKFFFLYPPALIYKIITDVRNLLYDKGILPSRRFSIPIICVGNITVGGTGKTPLTEYLAGLLSGRFRTAVLSRGYKRRSAGFRIVTPDSTAEMAGDEPLQISRKFPDIIVAVDKNRVEGVKTILREYPETEVIILDDGFQHRKIEPGLSILLYDFNRPVVKDHLLPYGNLRESRINIKRADVVIVTKSPESLSAASKDAIAGDIRKYNGQLPLFTSISYGNLLPVFKGQGETGPGLSDIDSRQSGAVLITGIAAPEPLKELVEKHFNEVIHLAFPDHHWFVQKDIERIQKSADALSSEKKFLITTSKDAVRLSEFINIDPLKKIFYYVPVTVRFPDDDKARFDKLIIEYAGKHK